MIVDFVVARTLDVDVEVVTRMRELGWEYPRVTEFQDHERCKCGGCQLWALDWK